MYFGLCREAQQLTQSTRVNHLLHRHLSQVHSVSQQQKKERKKKSQITIGRSTSGPCFHSNFHTHNHLPFDCLVTFDVQIREKNLFFCGSMCKCLTSSFSWFISTSPDDFGYLRRKNQRSLSLKRFQAASLLAHQALMCQ